MRYGYLYTCRATYVLDLLEMYTDSTDIYVRFAPGDLSIVNRPGVYHLLFIVLDSFQLST
jgi:hypothetical protein